MPSEFELIERCFCRPTRHTRLGAGDDGALIEASPGHEIVVSTDLLVEGTHFLPDVDAADLGWKTLAVNVSDMAAMGAAPRWATLGIAVPSASPEEGQPEAGAPGQPGTVPRETPAPLSTFAWLDDFARGFYECAELFGVDLIGGDTTRGRPGQRCFAVTILGEVPAGQALRRDGARPGDSIWVSGWPGRAARGLDHLQGRAVLPEPALAGCLAALHRPQPRVALGQALRGLATAAIDVSDGLLADLGHILERSQCAARLVIADVPAPMLSLQAYLAGGDDYELVFTAPAVRDHEVVALGRRLDLPLTRLGRIEAGPPGGLAVIDTAGNEITPARRGYDHFG